MKKHDQPAGKARKIIYWIATVWLSLGMLSTGIVQVFHLKAGTDLTAHMGYPDYFITMIGTWKIIGVVVLLLPKFALIKEWAYAGFFFLMTGAAISHIAAGTTNEIFPSLLLLTLTALSWQFRPGNRKLVSVHQ